MDSTSESGYATQPTATTGMPKGIPYIIGNEAAERFSFYGMKAILTIFMVDYLHRMGGTWSDSGMSNAEATEHYHTFTAAVYFTPVLGALLADAFLGKYRTILWLSIVYCLGHAALAMMGTAGLSAGTWLFAGLFLISLGSGGIKPCVSAHVGDQFGQSNKHLLTKVYQWFYFSINFGSFISTLLTPYLLEHFGPHWAFGVPGVLMAIATFLFWLGRHSFVHVPAGGTAFLRETFSWVGIATILKLAIIFAFVAPFWALFDQTGSSWVLQAKSLNLTWLGVTWLESQIQAVNPILVLILIPIYQFLIYPTIDRVFPLTPIRKIGLGLFVMTGGFAIVAFVQEWIDAGAEPSIGWQFLAYAVLTASEVMVSITCLEFAYTQAPKTMKSIIMAGFLFSISLGNVFTAAVNHFIQIPAASSLADSLDEDAIAQIRAGTKMPSLDPDWNAQWESGDTMRLRLAGADQEPNNDDDVVLTFDEQGAVTEMSDSAQATFEQAADKIEAAFFAQSGDQADAALLTPEQGNEILRGTKDPFGYPLRYRLLASDRYQILTSGGDGVDGSRWDIVLTSVLNRPAANNDSTNQDKPYRSWLQRRRIELEGDAAGAETESIQPDQSDENKALFERDYAIGGRTRLEGAAYFWFWTACIAATAVLFVPVGFFYREKTYIQDEVDADSPD
ncbi:MAG: POT family MFS transporter [Planctomycetota bacterium]